MPAGNIGFAAIWAGLCKPQLQFTIQLQFGLDVINLAMNKTSAILQSSTSVTG